MGNAECYPKCVDQPKCAANNTLCAGSGVHVMKHMACCSPDHQCVPWGDDWSVCRDKAHATCSVHGEQCAGTGGSSMQPPKACCDPADTCVVVNKYYSKCDSSSDLLKNMLDSCPGLPHCLSSE